MLIVIDESGSFSGVGTNEAPSVVGALVIPDHRRQGLLRQYRRLRRGLPVDGGEVKGRLLEEGQVVRVCQLLWQSGALFFASLVDLSWHSQAGLQQHQARAAQGLVANLTDQHNQGLVRSLYKLKHDLEKLPMNLFVQAAVMNDLLGRIVREAPLFFVQRRPEELGRLEWVVDAKSNSTTRTSWEGLWLDTVLGYLQTESLSNPMPISAAPCVGTVGHEWSPP